MPIIQNIQIICIHGVLHELYIVYAGFKPSADLFCITWLSTDREDEVWQLLKFLFALISLLSYAEIGASFQQ